MFADMSCITHYLSPVGETCCDIKQKETQQAGQKKKKKKMVKKKKKKKKRWCKELEKKEEQLPDGCVSECD